MECYQDLGGKHLDSLVVKKEGDVKAPHAEVAFEKTGACTLVAHVRQKTEFVSLMHVSGATVKPNPMLDEYWSLVHSRQSR